MKTRDPNLVFVGMATRDGGMTEQTRALWDRLDQPISPWRFLAFKTSGGAQSHARNFLTDLALRSDASRLLMIDSDVAAGESHVLRILGHGLPIVVGVYPRKEVRFPTRFVFRAVGALRPDGLVPAGDAGAGFALIDLAAVEHLIGWNALNGRGGTYRCEDDGAEGREIHDLWREELVEHEWVKGQPRFTRKLTEDYTFFHFAQRAGIKVYADTLCQVGHVGSVDFLEVARLIQRLKAPAQGA